MCTVDWGLVVNAIAAVGAVSAAVVALTIATRDRREREQQRRKAAQAQAKLVLVNVKAPDGVACFGVEVCNYGSSAVLDVELDSAEFASAPGSKRRPWGEDLAQSFAVLDADRKPQTFWIEFIDSAGQPVITGERDRHGNWQSDNGDPEQVTVAIRFTDSQGEHWKRSRDSIESL
jgi:hypothetical protein